MDADFLGTATYSPDDNKLRLYPFTRLSREDYDRVKSAGFKWAPKQELFVAPMWTPEREDLLLELAGEVGDDDKSLTERAEERSERFEDYSEARAKDSESARRAVSAIADNIPFGQPILVGHHSERRARRDAEKIENGMRRTVRFWEQSQYWQSRAAGALRHAKYKELPSVRARRIKTIEADKRRVERTIKDLNFCLQFWRGEKPKKTGGFFDPTDLKTALFFANHFDHHSHSYSLAEYPRTVHTYEGPISLWSALGGNIDGKPEAEQAIITPAQAIALVIPVKERYLERCNRWIAHYDHRLAYERALLDAAGGLATDRSKPEKGGAVRCWASHGGWSYVQKVNRVSVTVWDSWGRGGNNFNRTIKFDEIKGIMSAAEVAAARAENRLREHHDDGAGAIGFLLVDNTPTSPNGTNSEAGQLDKCESTNVQANLKNEIDGMKDSLRAGVQVVSAPQLFPTPPDLARQMISAAGIREEHTVLEPSAGTGAIVGLLPKCRHLTVVESNLAVFNQLANKLAAMDLNFEAHRADFLEITEAELLPPSGKFDRVVMNPPFKDAEDIRHIQRAYSYLKAGGRLVALCANGPRQQAALIPWVMNQGGAYSPLPFGSFAESGTNVNVAMLSLSKGGE